MTLTVRLTEAADEIDAAHDLRRRVFLGEQKVDAKDEFDEYEATSDQVVALDESVVVATCRLRGVRRWWPGHEAGADGGRAATSAAQESEPRCSRAPRT